MQDFLTEAAELIEQLDADLVRLESAAPGQESADLLNGCFRALHTVKGAASFLSLDPVIRFAHSAEDALNRLRRGDVRVTPTIMDALLKSADVLRSMVSALSEGEAPPECPPALFEALHAIGAITESGEAGVPATASASVASAPAAASASPTASRQLKLPSQKESLVELMVADLSDSAAQMDELVGKVVASPEAESLKALEELADSLCRTLDFFELPAMVDAMDGIRAAAGSMSTLPPELAPEVTVRLQAGVAMLREQSEALSQHMVADLETRVFAERLRQLAEGRPLSEDVANVHAGDIARLMEIDGIRPGSNGDASSASAEKPDHDHEHPDASETAASAGGAKSEESGAQRGTHTEATIRVEVGRLENLLSLVGQLVLTKNRMLALNRRLRQVELPAQMHSDVAATASELDRLTSTLQMGVMRTRMQPLSKLFDRYPRVVRDIARATGKQIRLDVIGKDTEVDKSVLELLTDPLLHILRNSADHGVELPDKRKATGKSEVGVITVAAEHRGSHVRIAVSDDGKGMDPKVIGAKAVERGLATEADVASMEEGRILQFIFAPGFSTAEKVSDLSGRGVGMDVVRTNVAKMGGAVNISSVVGKGSTIEILIPLTVAIMPAMVIGLNGAQYCIPLRAITEIVSVSTDDRHSVAHQPVIRLRDTILPLVDLRTVLNLPASEGGGTRFAVVVEIGSDRAGLLVDSLVGQQEIVIRPLDDQMTQGGPFSGATISEEGDVSLILDVGQLVRKTQQPDRAALAAMAAQE